MIIREKYLKSLNFLKGTNLIKVLTGIRRAGKSTILEQFAEQIISRGENVLHINFEKKEFEQLADADRLSVYIYDRIIPGQMNYVMLDEIQTVTGFEKLIDALFVEKDVDLYLTGSNAKFLSSDLVTLLSGRYIEERIYPYSFAEFASAYRILEGEKDNQELFNLYLAIGGFPENLNLHAMARGKTDAYLRALYETIVIKDNIERNHIKNEAAFRNVTRFALDSIGSELSPNGIANVLKQQNKAVDKETIQKYMDCLVNSFVLYKAGRFDLKGKKLLAVNSKYYAADIGLRQAILEKSNLGEIGHLIENIVYLELLSRMKSVYVGKVYGYEVDFVAVDANNERSYYQVTASMRDDSVRDRELRSLKAIGDHHSKYILTLDFEEGDYDGVSQKYLIKWLLAG